MTRPAGAGPGQGTDSAPPTDPPQGPGSTGRPGDPGAPGAGSKARPGEADSTRGLEDMTIGELAFEVTDRATVLVREEIELAKTEVSEKVNRLIRGSVVGLAAGIFAVLALILLMHSIAWGITDAFFPESPWTGFLIEGFIFILIAIGAGLFARRAFQDSAPPVPEMAIEQAKEIKAEFEERPSATPQTEGRK